MNLPSVSKSADYYSTHMDEAQKKMSECIGTPKMKSDEECKSAFEGMQKAGQDEIKQHP
jgi:hypothetical protein